MSAIKIIGVGRDGGGDDAAGIFAARKLRKLAMPGVEVIEIDGGGAALMEVWTGAGNVIIIDTTSTGSRPGAIHRCDPCDDEIPCELARYANNLSVAETLLLAQGIDLMPSCPILYGIEGVKRSGPDMTPAVERAIDRVVERVSREVRAIIAEHEVLSQDEDY